MNLLTVPEWLGAAVLGAVLAALGYVGKQIAEWVVKLRSDERGRRARLAELLALIRAGDAAWKVQCDDRDRLADLIEARQPGWSAATHGYDRVFALAYSTMTEQERELHDVVRAITVHTVQPLNEALLKWLQTDTEFRVAPTDRTPRGKLAQYLVSLEAHLLLWQAKYRIWIPEHPERALVYLDDEKRHGLGFPHGGTALVAARLHHKIPPASQPAEAAEPHRKP